MGEWQPIDTAPENGPVVLYYGKRVFHDMRGNPVSFGKVRDHAEMCEIGFCQDGDICEAGTGHSVWEDHKFPNNVPTHWMPLPAFVESKEGQSDG